MDFDRVQIVHFTSGLDLASAKKRIPHGSFSPGFVLH